jgi:spermidine synthase
MSTLPSPRFTYIANLPRIQENLDSVLVLGLGGGRNLSDLLSDSRVHQVVAVDWSKEIIKLVSSQPVVRYNGNPFSDPRLRVVKADAKQAVQVFARQSLKFDAIIDNLCFPSWAGAGGLRSLQYFKSIKDILKRLGFYYLIPNNTTAREREFILFTLSRVFEHISIHNGRIMICGSEEYLPSETQFRDVLTQEMLARSEKFLVPEPHLPKDYFSSFKNVIAPVDQSQIKKVTPLTDEMPVTEYFISIPFLVQKVLKGVKVSKRPNPSPAHH